ncbi:MAG: hypothetical protein AB1632_14000 [Nitrospirota bacterium]
MSERRKFFVVLPFFLFIFMFSVTGNVFSADNVVSGPFSLTILGGGHNDTLFTGVEGRLDYLNPVLNVHVFGIYDALDAGNGIGKIDNQRYGAGVAVSHTYPGKANAFVGVSFINEIGKNFVHAYVGGKYKLTENALVTGSYGFGFGPEREFEKDGKIIRYEASDWLKIGAVFVPMDKLKTNIYAYLESPAEKNIFGLEGEVSYYLQESVAVGIRGMADLTQKADLDRNWRAALFVTYSFGGQKGKLIDVALDKNQPTLFPRVTIYREQSPLVCDPYDCECICQIDPESEACWYCWPE